MFSSVKPYFITIDTSTGITVIIGPHMYNLYWIQRVDNQYRWSSNTLWGIVNGYLTGLYFFDNRLNEDTYLSFLQNKLSAFRWGWSCSTKNVIAARWCATPILIILWRNTSIISFIKDG